MAETEMERLKEEIRQQKDREDRMRSQINRCLKQKTDDFDKLYGETSKRKRTTRSWRRNSTDKKKN